MEEDLRNKLNDITDNYYFVSSKLESYIDKVIEKANDKYPNNIEDRDKYAISLMKHIIRKKINIEAKKSPKTFFSNFFEEMSEEPTNYKLSLLSNLINSVEDKDQFFYLEILVNCPEVKDLFNSIILKETYRVIQYSEEARKKYPGVILLLKEHARMEKLHLVEKKIRKIKEEIFEDEVIESKDKNYFPKEPFLSLINMYYSKEDVEKVCEALKNPYKRRNSVGFSMDDIEFLKEAYGEDFGELRIELNRSQKQKLYYIIYSKIPKILGHAKENKKKKKTFDYYLNKYTNDEQKLIMDSLTEKEFIFLKRKFGENLNEYYVLDAETEKYIKKILYNIIPNIAKGLLRNYKYDNCLFKEFLVKVYDVDEDEYKLIVNNLREDNLNILKRRYGENLDTYTNENDSDLTTQVKFILYSVIPAIINREKKYTYLTTKSINVSLISFLNEKYSKEEVEYIFKSLTDEEQKILNTYFDSGFENRSAHLESKDNKLRVNNLLYNTIPQRVKLMREGLENKIVTGKNKKLKK